MGAFFIGDDREGKGVALDMMVELNFKEEQVIDGMLSSLWHDRCFTRKTASTSLQLYP